MLFLLLDRCAYHPGAFGRGQTKSLRCNPPKVGRFVFVRLRTTEYLTLCEVEVYGSKGMLLLILEFIFVSIVPVYFICMDDIHLKITNPPKLFFLSCSIFFLVCFIPTSYLPWFEIFSRLVLAKCIFIVPLTLITFRAHLFYYALFAHGNKSTDEFLSFYFSWTATPSV